MLKKFICDTCKETSNGTDVIIHNCNFSISRIECSQYVICIKCDKKMKEMCFTGMYNDRTRTAMLQNTKHWQEEHLSINFT